MSDEANVKELIVDAVGQSIEEASGDDYEIQDFRVEEEEDRNWSIIWTSVDIDTDCIIVSALKSMQNIFCSKIEDEEDSLNELMGLTLDEAFIKIDLENGLLLFAVRFQE